MKIAQLILLGLVCLLCLAGASYACLQPWQEGTMTRWPIIFFIATSAASECIRMAVKLKDGGDQ